MIRVAFDVGGVLSKYPDILRRMITALLAGGAEVHVITDMPDHADVVRQLKRNEHDCAPAAVDAVRRWGGALEHPAGSLLWMHCRLPLPGGFADDYDGFSVEVDQCAWGHVARKRSWLYVVGVERGRVQHGVRTGGELTHWISGGRTSSSRVGSPVPPGIKVCSAQQRRRTPPAFAAWLVELARAARQRSEAA